MPAKGTASSGHEGQETSCSCTTAIRPLQEATESPGWLPQIATVRDLLCSIQGRTNFHLCYHQFLTVNPT